MNLSPKQIQELLKQLFQTKKLSAADEQQAKDVMDWAVRFMVCQYHFVHKVLGYMNRHYTYNLSTMGVNVQGSRLNLFINPAFVKEMKHEYIVFVLYHEVCHIVLHHCTSRRMGEPYLSQLAHDLAVNEIIPVKLGSCERPRDEEGNLIGLFVEELQKQEEFSDIQPMKSAEWYYNYLRKKRKEQGDAGGSGSGGGMLDPDGSGESMDSHQGWEENEVASEHIRAIVKEIGTTDSWGNLSAGARALIESAQIRKINWRNKIRTWFGNIAWKDRISTRRRPNRRTGLIHPGYRKSYVDRWLVAADTSGSVDNDLLGQWIGVLNQLVETLPIDFMQFDCNKTEEPHPYDRRMPKLEFKGRGGTDFNPVMKIVEERKYKGVMILTDGQAAPPPRPRVARVLWVLPEGDHPPVEWGERIHLTRGA